MPAAPPWCLPPHARTHTPFPPLPRPRPSRPPPACRADSGGECVRITQYELMRRAQQSLPFQLTGGQQRALDALLEEMRDWPPMMCLLQVGSCMGGAAWGGPDGGPAWGMRAFVLRGGAGGATARPVASASVSVEWAPGGGSGRARAPAPPRCMQGDVGCGKTAVAFLALLAAVGSGFQG